MKPEGRRRRLAAALSVSWTPAVEARTRARIHARIVQRRQRIVRAVVAFALVCSAGVTFAFTRGYLGRERPPVPPDSTAPRAPAPARPQPESASPPAQPPAPPAQPRDELPVRPGPSRARLFTHPSPPSFAPRPPAEDPIEARFAQADRARLAGKPMVAVALLQEIADRFPSDGRAAIAAFQLGRILADELGDPARAARAFDRALALAPAGPLADDARARAKALRATKADVTTEEHP